MPKSPLLSFWLLPRDEDRSLLQNIINQLAQQHESAEFCPHLTLFTIPIPTVLSHHLAIENPSPDAIALMDWETSLHPGIANLRPLALTVQDICSSPEFAKTVFIRLKTSPALLATITHLRQTISPCPPTFMPPIDPHISLIYQTLEPEEKEAIAQSIHISAKAIHFNELQVIQTPPQFEQAADVRQLRCLYAKTLKYA